MATLDSRQGRSFDPAAPVEHRGGAFLTGVFPGLYAGLVMALMICILAGARGVPLLEPFWVVASLALGGARAMAGGGLSTFLGLVIHFAMSAFLGGLFSRIFGRSTMRRLLAFGFLYAMFLWGIAQFLLLPILNAQAATQLGTVWPFFVGHLGYGFALASAMPSAKDIDAPAEEYRDSEVR
jgi:hypothetical protein